MILDFIFPSFLLFLVAITPVKKYDFSKIPECDLIVKFVNKRLKAYSGTNLFVIGLPGTGKSSTCQRLSELIQKSRDKITNSFIVGSLLELLEAIKKAKLGDIIIIEEVSVLFPSRRAMATENVAVGKIFDTIRKKNLCLISNCPIWNHVDSHIRALGDVLIETLKINKEEKVVISKFHRLQTNPSSGKTYKHTFTRNGLDVSRLYTRMPNSKKWKEYEERKEHFMDQLYAQLKHTQEKKEAKINKEMDKNNIKVKPLTTQELRVHQLVNVKGYTQTETAKELGITQQRIAQIIKNIVNKSKIAREKPKNKIVT